MDNKNAGNYSSLSNAKGANLCQKCTKIRLATGLRPNPLGERISSPRLPSRNEGPMLLKRGREGDGATLKGDGRGKEERGDGKEGEVNSPKVKVSKINTGSTDLTGYEQRHFTTVSPSERRMTIFKTKLLAKHFPS